MEKYFKSDIPQPSPNETQSQEVLRLIKQRISSIEDSHFLHTSQNLPLKPFLEDSFEYIDSEPQLKAILSYILSHEKAIGVDIEQTNVDSYQGYNCLIQISTQSQNYIIDAILLKPILAQYLQPIFENEGIVKVFYACGSDLQWLNRDYGIFVINIFDVYQASYFLDKRNDRSLGGLLGQYCSYKIDKQKKKGFQVSDWSQRPLSKEQLNYAILDAHYLAYLRNLMLEKMVAVKGKEESVGFIRQMQEMCGKVYQGRGFSVGSHLEWFNKEMKEIAGEGQKKEEENMRIKQVFLTLCKLRDDVAREKDKNPERLGSNRLLLELCLDDGKELSQEKIAQKIKEEARGEGISFLLEEISKIERVLKGDDLLDCEQFLKRKQGNHEEKKIRRKEQHEEKFTLKKNLYENCQVLAPDGEFLAHTKRKRLNWYINKGLATLISEEPPTIKLNFEPRAREIPDISDSTIDRDLYLKHHRLNRCVVCGQQERLSRFYIIPALYRQHLPLQFKNHNAHDILLTCFRCQEKAHAEADKFKVELAERYSLPLVQFEQPHEIKVSLQMLHRHLGTYGKHKELMGKVKKEKIKKLIREEFRNVVNSPGLLPEVKQRFEGFLYKEDGRVKINKEFIEYFEGVVSFKKLVQKTSNKDFKNIHGKLIIEKLKTIEEIRKFIDEWRMFFVKTMDPSFLPHDWHVMLESKRKALKEKRQKEENQEVKEAN